jgi:hypothetical protein
MTTLYEITFASTDTVQVRVAIVDRVGQVDGLAAFLPMRWATQHYDSLYAVGAFDLIVLGGATAEMVAATRLLHPDGTIIAIIDADADVDPLVEVLQAGADTCVRAGAPAVLAGHLMASQRRRLRDTRVSHNRARMATPSRRNNRP